MEISELGEFGLIERLAKDIATKNETTVKGIGDDCAVIAPTEGMRTIVTTDLLMEGPNAGKRTPASSAPTAARNVPDPG